MAIYIFLIVLLPIIPAYILYKTLPSRTKVSGPFKGLNIQLTGAFGGYFIVALLVSSFITVHIHLLERKFEFWTVDGNIQLEQGGFNPKDVLIAIMPPRQNIDSNGRFIIERVPLFEKQIEENSPDKPKLVILKDGYEMQPITLESVPPKFVELPEYDIKYDRDKKNIRINKPIILKQKNQH